MDRLPAGDRAVQDRRLDELDDGAGDTGRSAPVLGIGADPNAGGDAAAAAIEGDIFCDDDIGHVRRDEEARGRAVEDDRQGSRIDPVLKLERLLQGRLDLGKADAPRRAGDRHLRPAARIDVDAKLARGLDDAAGLDGSGIAEGRRAKQRNGGSGTRRAVDEVGEGQHIGGRRHIAAQRRALGCKRRREGEAHGDGRERDAKHHHRADAAGARGAERGESQVQGHGGLSL
jgi:hypothetical protein